MNTSEFPGQGYRLGKESLANNTIISRSRRPPTVNQRMARRGAPSRDNLTNFDPNTQLLSPTARYRQLNSITISMIVIDDDDFEIH